MAVTSGPASSAPAPTTDAVKGLHQAFEASVYRGPPDLEEAVPTSVRFLTGTRGSADGLAASRPRTATGLAQAASASGDEDDPADVTVASWRGQLTGALDGALELTWWWSSPTASFGDEVVAVAVVADPGSAAQRVLARSEVVVQAGAVPTRNVSLVPVHAEHDGPVAVQARPARTSASPVLLVHYGSVATPSAMAYRAAAKAAPYDSGKQHNVESKTYRGPALVVSANYIGRDAAEPTVGIDKDGVAFMAAGAFDAIPDNPITNLARTEIKRSDDGGETWQTVQFTLPGDAASVPPTTLDPYVYVDEDTGRVFTPDLYLACNYLQYSDDKGESWTQSPVACGQPGLNDHQTIVTGPVPEGEPDLGIYPNYVYYCFNRIADASCGRSLDGGLTWLPAGQPAFAEAVKTDDGTQVCGSLHGHIVTDNRGRLYLPKGHCGFPWLAISEDGAQTWRRVQVSDKWSSASTHLAVDVDTDGTVYFLWWTAEDRLPLLAHSKDGGNTWSEPVLVAPPGVEEVNFPTIDAGKPGQVAISFPGTRADVGDPDVDAASRPWNYYVMTSLNADTARPLFVSTTAQPVGDPIHRGNCGPGRCAGMFDFIDVEFAPSGEIWAAATDTCTAEAECNTAAGSSAPSAEGVAIRQLSGPGLAAPVAPPAAPAQPRPPTRPAPRSSLPATGASAPVVWSALAAAAAAAIGARARRAHGGLRESPRAR